ncbi:Acetokinase family-domain-containing protein [Peziza echinospora]|nr:Acetokinase family-domain-containing protein [Peziza echinospora]
MSSDKKPTYILSINTGSSSVKFSLFSVDPKNRTSTPPTLILESSVSKITSPPAIFKYTHKLDRKPSSISTSSDHPPEDIKDKKLDGKDGKISHDDAFQIFLDQLSKDSALGISGNNIKFTCHRIVHGGDFPKAVTIDDKTYQYIDQLTDLAPLHNKPALAIVESCFKRLPKTHNIAYFDTAFHITMPDHIKMYPINLEQAAKRKIRKYGFHGISYGFITRSVAEYLGKPLEELNIIALHLGSGASACAIKNGKSYDNSMGLTPLEGLPGATRSGTVDPSMVFHYTSNAGILSQSSTSDMHISKAEEILNKQSGWSAITGTSDFSTIIDRSSAIKNQDTSSTSPEDQKYKLALDIFIDRVIGFIGSYYVKLGGDVDALVFAGGIGEKSAVLRKMVVEKVAVLGFKIADDGGEKVVEGMGPDKSTVDITGDHDSLWKGQESKESRKVLVCRTDEQFEMARNCTQEDGLW